MMKVMCMYYVLICSILLSNSMCIVKPTYYQHNSMTLVPSIMSSKVSLYNSITIYSCPAAKVDGICHDSQPCLSNGALLRSIKRCSYMKSKVPA